MNPFKPGIVEQSDPKRVMEALQVPKCCAACDSCGTSQSIDDWNRLRMCGHKSLGFKRSIDVDPNSARPTWCPLNTSFVRA